MLKTYPRKTIAELNDRYKFMLSDSWILIADTVENNAVRYKNNRTFGVDYSGGYFTVSKQAVDAYRKRLHVKYTPFEVQNAFIRALLNGFENPSIDKIEEYIQVGS